MNRITAHAATFATALVAIAASFGAQAQSSGYDYASKFYPHPAWMHLKAEAPREMGQHPAVLVARRAALPETAIAQAHDHVYPHPARGTLVAEAPREMGLHPAVLVARRAAGEQAAAARAATLAVALR